MLTDWAGAEDFTLRVCIEGDCQSLQVTDASSYAWLGMPLNSEVSGGVSVEVTISSENGNKTATGNIELENFRPNGAFCAPVCQGADVTVDGDTLRNAEGGETAPNPRD
jgi:hypothetical protein